MWGFLIGVLAISSLFAGLLIVPNLLSSKSNFSISPSSNMVVAQANAQNPLNLTLTSQNGFTGVVLLKTLASSKVLARFSTNSYSNPINGGTIDGTVPLASTSNSTLWIDPLSAGNYSITIVASSLGVSHSIQVSIIAEDLHMAFNPPSLTLARNTSANVTMTLSSLNGLTALLNLPGTYYPGVVSAHEFPSQIFVPRGGIITTTMNVFAYSYATTGPFSVTAQIILGPNAAFYPGPSPPGPLWTFSVNYNLTIT